MEGEYCSVLFSDGDEASNVSVHDLRAVVSNLDESPISPPDDVGKGSHRFNEIEGVLKSYGPDPYFDVRNVLVGDDEGDGASAESSKSIPSSLLIKIKQVNAWMFNSCISNGAPTVDEAQWNSSCLSNGPNPLPPFEEVLKMAGKSGDIMTQEDFIKAFTQQFDALPAEVLQQLAPGVIASISEQCAKVGHPVPAG